VVINCAEQVNLDTECRANSLIIIIIIFAKSYQNATYAQINSSQYTTYCKMTRAEKSYKLAKNLKIINYVVLASVRDQLHNQVSSTTAALH